MKILNKLTIKHLTLNKKRTITTILGICLSTALMVGIGLLFSTIRDEAIKVEIADKGEYIIKYENIKSDKLEFVTKNNEIKEYYYTSSVGTSNFDDAKDDSYFGIEVVKVDKNFFNHVELLEGSIPTSNNEILVPNHYIRAGYEAKLGENITVLDKTYKIVGIIAKTPYEMYYSGYYQMYTPIEIEKDDLLTIYINVKKMKNTYKIGEYLTKNLEAETDCTTYNNMLLSLNGVSRYSNLTDTMFRVLSIVLGLIAIGCIIVIYNSFSISVMERKKQFGLFASIGTTRKQLRYTVFFEALIVGVIGIILGILSAYFGIGIVVVVVNNLLKDVFTIPLALSTYPMFLIIPVIFMIITVFFSAFIPAKRAAKTSPIVAIRQNDDIKISSKKIKTNKLALKLFGVEGEIALKNIKRNKKKYRITVLSLIVSIVLFISFSALLEYGFKSSTDLLDVPKFNIAGTYSDDNVNQKVIEKLQKLRKNYQVKGSLLVTDYKLYNSNSLDDKMYNSKLINLSKSEKFNVDYTTEIFVYSDSDYEALKKKYNVSEDVPFLVDYYEYTSYKNSKRKLYSGGKYSDKFDGNITVVVESDFNYTFKNVKLIDQEDYIMQNYSGVANRLIVNDKMMEDIRKGVSENYYYEAVLTIEADKYDEIVPILDEIDESYVHFSYYNFTEQMRTIKNIILVVEILLYGFISLVTLIGVTSVFNTINTSMNLRRKEFATLRSIGLSPKGFNKMLYFESIFFGLKSLVYALPISIGTSYLICLSLKDTVEYTYRLPFKSMGIAIISVFIIVLTTMMYSTSKIKRENILDAIREENI